MVSASMKEQLDQARGAPGFKSEADVVRYALEQILPTLVAKAAERYTGRTRMLVDTATPAKRVGSEREPVRLRGDAKFEPFDPADLDPFLEALNRNVAEIAALTDPPNTDPFGSAGDTPSA
jgi:Arc/MetJ-type ribon-helix-helix transcriptional regulator